MHTYTILLKQLDEGKLPNWQTMKAPQEAIDYYNLKPEAKLRDVILSIRADEVCHREVNHHFADIPTFHDIEMEEVEILKDGSTKAVKYPNAN